MSPLCETQDDVVAWVFRKRNARDTRDIPTLRCLIEGGFGINGGLEKFKKPNRRGVGK